MLNVNSSKTCIEAFSVVFILSFYYRVFITHPVSHERPEERTDITFLLFIGAKFSLQFCQANFERLKKNFILYQKISILIWETRDDWNFACGNICLKELKIKVKII
jgi:hypothetical protein